MNDRNEPIVVMRSPRTVDIAITGRCNLRCAYCSHFSAPGDNDTDLPTEEWLRFFKELNRYAVMNVILQGGEPFLRKDLKRIIEGIVENRMRYTLLSNGTLVSSDMAAFIAETKRCDGVQVSIDGASPITHDTFRGKGVFHKALNGLEKLRSCDVPTTVRVTIHRKNVGQLDAIAELLLDEIGLPSFSTNTAGYLGLCRSNSDHIQLSIEDRTLAMKMLKDLNLKYNGRIVATAGPLMEANLWEGMIRASHTDLKESAKGCLTACNGPYDTIGVRSDGVMVPCILLSHMALGRINQDDLQAVWRNHPELKRIRSRKFIPLDSFAFCKDCEFINHCTGNCPALAYTLTGDENHPSPDACLKRFLEAGGTLP